MVNQYFKPIDPTKARAAVECNDFLKTRKGLEYLLLKYQNLSVKQAIKECKFAVYEKS